uniref:Uncharacterized protein n=1 Tax=Octopus bimaculoides TaxID=37653 RepID=A0A0L8FV57_OCTBM
MIFTLDPDRLRRRTPDYWTLNTSLPAYLVDTSNTRTTASVARPAACKATSSTEEESGEIHSTTSAQISVPRPMQTMTSLAPSQLRESSPTPFDQTTSLEIRDCADIALSLRAVSAYADNIIVIESDTRHVNVIDTALKEYKALTGAIINQEKSVALKLGTWRCKPMTPNNVLERWTEGPVKLFGVWFGLDLQGSAIPGYAMILEMFSTDKRTLFSYILGMWWGICVMILALVAYVMKHSGWRWLCAVLGFPGIVCVFEFWYLRESIRWLFTKGKIEEAKRIVKHAANLNGVDFDTTWTKCLKSNESPVELHRLGEQSEELIDRNGTNLEDEAKEQVHPKETAFGLWTLMKYSTTRNVTLVVMFAWLITSLTYFGLYLTSSSLSGDRHLNFFLIAFMEFPSSLVLYKLLMLFIWTEESHHNSHCYLSSGIISRGSSKVSRWFAFRADVALFAALKTQRPTATLTLSPSPINTVSGSPSRISGAPGLEMLLVTPLLTPSTWCNDSAMLPLWLSLPVIWLAMQLPALVRVWPVVTYGARPVIPLVSSALPAMYHPTAILAD